MLTEITLFGIDITYIFIGLIVLFILSFLLNIISLTKISGMKKRYQSFLSGKDGNSLEEEILDRFECLDQLKESNKELAKKIDFNRGRISTTYSKMKVIKYNAFDNMGGETSFVLGLLNEHNNGILLNGMSSRNGSYIYAKEVMNGKAKVVLSDEEQRTLTECMNQ